MRLKPIGSTLAAALLVGGTASFASADLVAQDSFLIGNDEGSAENYEHGVSIRSKEPNEPVGFQDDIIWGGNSSNFLSTSGSLGAGTGGKVEVIGVARPDPAGSDLTRFLVRNLENTSSSTFYMGSLLNRGSGLGNDDAAAPIHSDSFALTGFINGGSTAERLQNVAGSGNLFGLTWGFSGNNAEDGYDIVLRDRHNPSGTGAVGSDIMVANRTLLADADANTTYVALFKFELNDNSPDRGTGNDGVTYWIGTPDTLDASSEGAATASALATGTLASYGFNTADDFNSNAGRGMFAQYKYEAENALFDELTLSTDFASIGAIVPEPASAGLLLGAGALLLGRRRR